MGGAECGAEALFVRRPLGVTLSPRGLAARGEEAHAGAPAQKAPPCAARRGVGCVHGLSGGLGCGAGAQGAARPPPRRRVARLFALPGGLARARGAPHAEGARARHVAPTPPRGGIRGPFEHQTEVPRGVCGACGAQGAAEAPGASHRKAACPS